jgi:hypothetical protein
LTLGKAAHFPADGDRKSDVVHVGVSGDDAKAIHGKLSALPNTDPRSTNGYHPHLTLAYVIPGKGKDYDGMEDLDGVTVASDRLCFSDAAGKRTDILLTGRKAIAMAVTKDVSSEADGASGGMAVADKPRCCPKCETMEAMDSGEDGAYTCAACGRSYRVKDDGEMEEMAQPVAEKTAEPAPVIANPRCDMLALAAKGEVDHAAAEPVQRAGTSADYLAITQGTDGRPAYLYPVGANGKASAKLVAKAIVDATNAGHTEAADLARKIAAEVDRYPLIPPTYVSPETIRKALAHKQVERNARLLRLAEAQFEDQAARLLGKP